MRLHWAHFFCFLVVFSVSCDESLPPRQDPSGLFSLQVQQNYLYDANDNNLLISLFAFNNFDETLSDRMFLSGTVVITSNRDTSVHKTYQLSALNLIHGTYDASKGILTINPGDFAELRVDWDFTDDSGLSLDSYFFQYSLDRSCQERSVAKSETFTITARARLFSNLGYTQSQFSFNIAKYDVFVGPHDCHPL